MSLSQASQSHTRWKAIPAIDNKLHCSSKNSFQDPEKLVSNASTFENRWQITTEVAWQMNLSLLVNFSSLSTNSFHDFCFRVHHLSSGEFKTSSKHTWSQAFLSMYHTIRSYASKMSLQLASFNPMPSTNSGQWQVAFKPIEDGTTLKVGCHMSIPLFREE